MTKNSDSMVWTIVREALGKEYLYRAKLWNIGVSTLHGSEPATIANWISYPETLEDTF